MIPWLILCAVCCLVYWLVTTLGTIPSWRTIRLFNKLQGPTDQPFFIGATWNLMRMKSEDRMPYIKDKFNRFGEWFAVYTMGQPWLLVMDPEIIRVILLDNININKGPEYRLLEDVFRRGLFSLTGEKWKQRRKLLIPSFHFELLQNSIECMNRNGKKVVDALMSTNGAPLEPDSYIQAGAFRIINETAMETVLKDNDAAGNKYLEASKRIFPMASKRGATDWMKNDFLFKFSSLSKPYKEDIEILQDFVRNVIKARRVAFAEKKQGEASQYSEADGIGKKRRVFLDSLLELCNTEEQFRDDDILDEVHIFMMGGHHSTSVALRFLMLRMAENPDIQEKAYQEQVEIFGDSDRDVTHDDLSKMQYLDQVIKETLRLNPPFPEITRLLIKDIKLPNGQIVPKGTKITIDIFSTHRNPKYWDDPEAFNPERFGSEQSKSRHPFSYIPFSAGPRNCIAFKFALQNLKLFASILLRYCKLSAVTRSEDLKYIMMITLESTTPIKIQVSPRS